MNSSNRDRMSDAVMQVAPVPSPALGNADGAVGVTIARNARRRADGRCHVPTIPHEGGSTALADRNVGLY